MAPCGVVGKEGFEPSQLVPGASRVSDKPSSHIRERRDPGRNGGSALGQEEKTEEKSWPSFWRKVEMGTGLEPINFPINPCHGKANLAAGYWKCFAS